MAPQTGIEILDWFLRLLEVWGYLIVGGFTVFENTFIVGSFTPGETVVIAAAFVASGGALKVWGVWLASMTGTLLGSNAGYVFGRRAGVEGVRLLAKRASGSRFGRLLRIHPAVLEEVHEHFHTHGAKTIFISRFAVGAKNFVPAVAGAVKMPFLWFELFTCLGAMAYSTLMCLIGWFLGANIRFAVRIASSIGWAGLLLLVLFGAVIVFSRRRISARRAARAGDEESGFENADEFGPDFADAE